MRIQNKENIKAIKSNLRYFELLSKKYPSINEVCTEIINLKAILNLPKGTEHFISDIHGENESFTHVLKNASGVIKRKINDIFGNSLIESEKQCLASLIYYPEQKLQLIKKVKSNMNDWYKITLYRLVKICRNVCSKYTRSKVRKALPQDFAYVIEELLHEDQSRKDKYNYYNSIIQAIIDTNRSDEFIIAISKVIKTLVVDRLHIVGDIYDRGPGADIIMEALIKKKSLDIQWGNHDILWMAAAAGSKPCIANAVRICLRYANLRILEDGYGINLLPLASFSIKVYGDDDCINFIPKTLNKRLDKDNIHLYSKMHKAISIIQFKLEGQMILNHPEFMMNDRLLLHKINIKDGTIKIGNKTYKLNDTNFPTVDWNSPYKLTPEEDFVIKKLCNSFVNSEKLQKHTKFLYNKGSMYLIYNSNLIYHGCIPLNRDGSFKEVEICGHKYKGKSVLDKFDELARKAYSYNNYDVSNKYKHILWYLWCGPCSPIFGKKKMTTFERYFIDNKECHYEPKDYYYRFRDNEKIVTNILKEFNLDVETSHIINGHIPVKTKNGESPIKANGKLIAIDGGFCKAYQPQTGIAGYTLIYNSYGLILASHKPFESSKKAIEENKDIISSTKILEHSLSRKLISDTDIGKILKEQIHELNLLLYAYKEGIIKQKTNNFHL